MRTDANAAAAFHALSQPTRLAAFRVIVAGGEMGVTAGMLAVELGVPHNTLSTHLGILRDVALIRINPDGRLRRNMVDRAGVRELIETLMAACCDGHPDRCLPGVPAAPRHEETEP